MIEINERHPAWRAAYQAQELHVFRMRIVCPCCSSVWYQDVLDIPEGFEIPDRRKMGLAMLCGSCEARRVTLFVVPGKGGWSAPFLTPSEIKVAYGRLYDAPKGTWIKADGLGPWYGGHRSEDVRGPLRDDRRDVFCACTTRERDGRRYNVTAMTAETLAASGLDWKAPPPPIGITSGDSW